jgi:rhodanese-related sulfurtransferase
MSFIKKLFGIGPSVDYSKLISDGAIIVDVRTPSEYLSGHIKGSVNIPLDNFKSGIGKLKKGKAVITCCASGMRSAAAKNLLSNSGFTEVYNGGGWMSLQRKIS